MIRWISLIFLFVTNTSLACSVFENVNNYRGGLTLQNLNDFSVRGSPTVSDAGDLTIRGAAGRIVALYAGYRLGEFCIVANTEDSYSVWTVLGVTRDVKFIQGSNNDNERFEIIGLDYPQTFFTKSYIRFPRNLIIRGGAAGLMVYMGGERHIGFYDPGAEYVGIVSILGDLKISTSGGDDYILMGDTWVHGATSIVTRNGNDKIATDLSYPCYFGERLTVNTGNGDDIYHLANYYSASVATGSTVINMGRGADLLASISYWGGEWHFNAGYFTPGEGDLVYVNMGPGDDVSHYAAVVQDWAWGRDDAYLTRVVHSDGPGNDRSNIQADSIWYRGGSGIDCLVTDTAAVGSVLNGSTGTDTLISEGGGAGAIINFEVLGGAVCE